MREGNESCRRFGETDFKKMFRNISKALDLFAGSPFSLTIIEQIVHSPIIHLTY
jgi:hypothetical protein